MARVDFKASKVNKPLDDGEYPFDRQSPKYRALRHADPGSPLRCVRDDDGETCILTCRLPTPLKGNWKGQAASLLPLSSPSLSDLIRQSMPLPHLSQGSEWRRGHGMDAMVKPWHDELDKGRRGGWIFIGLETDLPQENPLRRHSGRTPRDPGPTRFQGINCLASASPGT